MRRFGPPLKTGGDNSNFVPVLAERQIGKFLLEQAKKSERIRLQLVETLLRPKPFFPPTPHLSQSEVVTAIRVALSASCDLGLDSVGRERWQMIENLVLYSLVQNSWPLLPADVRTAKRGIRKIEPLLPPEVIQKALAELDELEKKYEARIAVLKSGQREGSSEVREGARKVLESIGFYRQRPGLRRSPRTDRGRRSTTPAGGRPISEWKQRWVATFYLLKYCGNSDPAAAGTIVALLKKHSIVQSASKIMEAVKIYERAAASHRADALVSSLRAPRILVTETRRVGRPRCNSHLFEATAAALPPLGKGGEMKMGLPLRVAACSKRRDRFRSCARRFEVP